MTNLFIYGTLLPGMERDITRIEGTKFIKDYELHGYQLYMGNYPTIIETGDENDFVVGKVYEVDNNALGRITQIEGYYIPVAVETWDEDEPWLVSFVDPNYTDTSHHNFTLIPSGDFYIYRGVK
jgi:gamma-glutamylcyclotransferase (GGCT)/AIG2-like uncharacterized protein YtfP